MTTDRGREAVVLMCDATGLSLSTCRYDAQRSSADAHLSGRITVLYFHNLRCEALNRLEYLYRSCHEPVAEQSDLFRLTYVIESLKVTGWRNYLLFCDRVVSVNAAGGCGERSGAGDGKTEPACQL